MDTKEAEPNVYITGVCTTVKCHLHTDIKGIEPCVRITEVSVLHFNAILKRPPYRMDTEGRIEPCVCIKGVCITVKPPS